MLTSQRVTDVILSAFRASAGSQGCMNNFTFGDPHVGYPREKEEEEEGEKRKTNERRTREKKLTSLFRYYETIAGGAGAGPTWHGTSAVQVHMTNTRITGIVLLFIFFPSSIFYLLSSILHPLSCFLFPLSSF